MKNLLSLWLLLLLVSSCEPKRTNLPIKGFENYPNLSAIEYSYKFNDQDQLEEKHIKHHMILGDPQMTVKSIKRYSYNSFDSLKEVKTFDVDEQEVLIELKKYQYNSLAQKVLEYTVDFAGDTISKTIIKYTDAGRTVSDQLILCDLDSASCETHNFNDYYNIDNQLVFSEFFVSANSDVTNNGSVKHVYDSLNREKEVLVFKGDVLENRTIFEYSRNSPQPTKAKVYDNANIISDSILFFYSLDQLTLIEKKNYSNGKLFLKEQFSFDGRIIESILFFDSDSSKTKYFYKNGLLEGEVRGNN
ncbi:MAG: hypothetical protein HWE07_00540 [Cytophagia bacterium]|nr:hypothetical protein [Cytophagia bacterium]